MIVKLLTEHHLELLSLKGGCRGSSESTLVKISNCWKSHATAHFASSSKILSSFTIKNIQHNAIKNSTSEKLCVNGKQFYKNTSYNKNNLFFTT